MIKLIVGTKGSGKTKAMIDQINDAVKTSKGNVVVVEKGMKLTYDIAPAARLIDLDEYIKRYGADRFRALLDGVGNALDFRLKRCIAVLISRPWNVPVWGMSA